MLSRCLSILAPIPCTIRAWTGPDRLNRPRTHRRPRRHDGRADSSRNHRRLETGYAEPIPDLMADPGREPGLSGSGPGGVPDAVARAGRAARRSGSRALAASLDEGEAGCAGHPDDTHDSVAERHDPPDRGVGPVGVHPLLGEGESAGPRGARTPGGCREDRKLTTVASGAPSVVTGGDRA